MSSLVKLARSLNVPVVVSIWLSKVVSVPVASCLTLARSNAVTGRVAPLFSRAAICGRLSSGTAKIDADRLDLGDDHDAVGIGHLDVIALIDLAQADPPADRRDDAAISDVEVGGVDLRLVARHRRLVLRDQELLVLNLLEAIEFCLLKVW